MWRLSGAGKLGKRTSPRTLPRRNQTRGKEELDRSANEAVFSGGSQRHQFQAQAEFIIGMAP